MAPPVPEVFERTHPQCGCGTLILPTCVQPCDLLEAFTRLLDNVCMSRLVWQDAIPSSRRVFDLAHSELR